jgi:group I intron endonuclease
VYETKNLINNKIYVGVKSSKHFDDGYFGSGTLLKKAMDKHGFENFAKRVLWVFGTAKEAYEKEAEIVNEQFIQRNDTYNIATGGKGGWLGEAVNEKRSASLMGHKISDETKRKIAKAQQGNTSRRGAKWSEESKKKLSNAVKGREAPNRGIPHSEVAKAKMRKPHKTTGPKIRLSCVGCGKETTVNAFWRHKLCPIN